MNTEAFLNGIASFQGGFNEDDANFARGEGPLPRAPIFQHQRTPAAEMEEALAIFARICILFIINTETR